MFAGSDADGAAAAADDDDDDGRRTTNDGRRRRRQLKAKTLTRTLASHTSRIFMTRSRQKRRRPPPVGTDSTGKLPYANYEIDSMTVNNEDYYGYRHV